MDAQSRGRAENIDPADQWVLNPNTGEYELRLGSSAPHSPVPAPRTSRRGRPADPEAERGGGAALRGAPERGAEVPQPRRRRGAEPEPPPGRRNRRPVKKKSKAKKIVAWTGGGMALVLVAVGSAGYLYLKHLEGNVSATDVGSAAKQGFSKDDAFNILIIGTDRRTGKGNEGYGDKNSVGHADTNILLHVAKDRTNATALSIPRDLVVDVPDCETNQSDGSKKVVPGSSQVRFNESLGQEGRDAGCTMRTVKAVTGITPDHFMMVDFNAVKTLTSAVGGVKVCLKHAVKDKDSHLDLPAGESDVEGEQALAFVRTRHAWGNAGDLDRIKVQQQFMGSLMRDMSSGDTLTNPAKLLALAEAATKALTVDQGIKSVGTLKDIALELKKVPPKNITFMTVPVKDNPADGVVHKTVIVDQGLAPAIFDAINGDVSFTDVKKREKAAKDAQAARLKGSRSTPSEVRVRVMNGGAVAGSAQETLNWMQTEKGILKSENAGNAPAEVSRTVLEYAPDQAPQARELAALMGLSGAALKPGRSVDNAQGLPAMSLTLGKDFKGAGISLTAPAKAPEVTGKSTADKVECAS
ncbi:LCP family protein [Streptomyces sp. NPDC058459]|uniref:LCP family protein n=1 Tax=Streptomyces sp. NPDC058459 TaxID=3346508 RepID=UPI003669C77F